MEFAVSNLEEEGVDPADFTEIMGLLQRYCWAVDHGLWERWADCFTVDALLTVRDHRGRERQASGRDAIRKLVHDDTVGFRLVRHLQHLPELCRERTGVVSGRSYFELRCITGAGSDIASLGVFLDTLVADGSLWRIQERTISFEEYGTGSSRKRS